MGFLLGGGRLAIWYYFPRGRFCYGFSSGKGLPYGIISAGTISHGIWFPYHEICVGGGGEIYHRGETLPYGIVSAPREVLSWDFFRGKGNACLGIEQIHDNA